MNIVKYPLVVDLDGTLILTDSLHESILLCIRHSPMIIFKFFFWLIRGKAYFKKRISQTVVINPALLPYNNKLIEFLNIEKNNGRDIILCTAADESIAHSVSSHLGIFSDLIASNGVINLSGSKKASELIARYGLRGFDYAGNSFSDFHVWKVSNFSLVVNATSAVQKKALALFDNIKIFPADDVGILVWARLLRVHQWLKNILIFLPLVAAHQFFDFESWVYLFLAFLSFSLSASSVYIYNDLLDLESDRIHPRKKMRPFASGTVPIWKGFLIAPFLIFLSFLISFQINYAFSLVIFFYLFLTTIYSFALKRIILIDCIALAFLYTIRTIAGSVILGHVLSFWLLAFSVFLFLSLAFIKRFAELKINLVNGDIDLHGRGYNTNDLPFVQIFGISSGMLSVLVFAFYLNSEAVLKLYKFPEIIWFAVPILMFWIQWMWVQAHRGNMHDDPLIFAIKDRVSLISGLFFSSIILIGSFGIIF